MNMFIVSACMAIPVDIVPSLSKQVTWLPTVSREVVGLALVLAAGLAAFVKDLSILDRVLKPAILLIIYLMLLVVMRAFFEDVSPEMKMVVWEHPNQSLSRRLMDSLSLAMVAFGAEPAILTIRAQTSPGSKWPVEGFMTKVIDRPMLILLAIYFVFGLSGYSEFGASVEANLLVAMGNDFWSIIASFGLAFVNSLKVPLFNVVQWDMILDVFPAMQKIEDHMYGLGRALVVSAMNGVSLGLLLLLSDFGSIMGYMGGVLGIPVFLLLPCVVWLTARSCSRAPLEGRHTAVDALAAFILVVMSGFYVVNLTTLFK